jgi:hypothetical protein
MRWNRVAGILVGLASLALSSIVAGILCAYLTEYGERRIILAAAVVAVGVVVGVVVYALVSRHCKSNWHAVIVVALLIVLLLAPLASMAYPGKVVYSRFGFTVYGIIPVPVLDITVGPRGGLWFRDKSHFISIDEVQPLLSPDVEILVVGIGWDSAVRVDSAIEQIEGIEIHVLPTPEAFDLFNRYVSEGRRVVLVAHSTC